MTDVKIKRVYEELESSDGYRIFVDRIWPRGMRKENLKYDIWEKGITPSSSLRAWFHEDMNANWDMFSNLYRKELSGSDEVKSFIKKIEEYPTVTLLYASKESVHNHARILQDYIKNQMELNY